jgi:flagellar basal-body rod protein FlgF
MYKGIYIAVSGAILKQTQLDILSQNLANTNTVGYKKDNMSFQEYLMPQETSGPGPDGRSMTELSAVTTDFANGTSVKTMGPLDVALEGKGFLSLEGNRYTRRGDLKKSADGYLTTFDGVKVLGSAGPIKLPDGKVEITEQGVISVNDAEIGRLKIVDFKDTAQLEKAGDGMFTTNEKTIPASAGVKQGYIEGSNVDPIKEMVRMIETLREFETYQKAITTFDDATAKVTNDLGRL